MVNVLGVVVAAPATFVRGVGSTANLAFTVDQLQCSHKFSMLAKKAELARPFPICVKAHLTNVNLFPNLAWDLREKRAMLSGDSD